MAQTDENGAVRSVVIAGGGTAGWMTAAALAKLLGQTNVRIRLIESELIGTVGVGEATLPHLRFFNDTLGIDEADFLAGVQGTIKLGIQFRDWARIGDAYIHPFGDYGRDIAGVEFLQYWLRLNKLGRVGRICEYSLPVMIAEMERFAPPAADPRAVMSSFSYAYHIDAGLYAKYLRVYSEARGVERIEGKIAAVNQRAGDGFIESLTMESGEIVAGDLFIDCTGFRGLLIEQTLRAGFEDWSENLPCDRAVAAPCESPGPPLPYTRATARPAGWQWRIPLQHRMGNGYVYCSKYISDDDAAATLLANLEGALAGEPRFLKFTAGKRRLQWSKNCVAIGLASGFLEPLESTSIYLIQAGVTVLAELFPRQRFDRSDIDEFNRVMDLEYERVRDFLVLHYHATERNDSPFWDYARTMPIPDSLAYKMELFRKRGHILRYKDGLFLHPSWVAVYLGQRIVPQGYDPLADRPAQEDLERGFADLKQLIARTAAGLPPHHAYLQGARAAAMAS